MKSINSRRKTRQLAAAFAAGVAAVAPIAANGASDAASIFSLRGFGTLGAVHSSEKNADFVSSFFEPNGAGNTHNWALGVHSKIGLQVDARFNNRLSAVLQIVSQHRYDNTYTPQVEWANVKYQFTPDFDVRLGRTVAMPFMVSESRLVGYGNPWIRPPQEVYGLIPITNKDGIDATYRFQVAEVTNSLHASYGTTSPKLPASGKANTKRDFDLANTIEYGPTTFRVSYTSGRVDLHTPELDALIAGFTQFGNTLTGIPGFGSAGAQAFALADKYRFENARISALALGASYDRGPWLLMTEWAKFSGHSLLADSSAWYVTGGYRIREFTPYVTVAGLTAEKRLEPGLASAGMPPALATTAAALNAGLSTAIAGATFAQRSITAGVRWDFRKNAALKVQYDRLNLDAGSSGRLGSWNIQPNFQPGGTVNVFSLAVDFVF